MKQEATAIPQAGLRITEAYAFLSHGGDDGREQIFLLPTGICQLAAVTVSRLQMECGRAALSALRKQSRRKKEKWPGVTLARFTNRVEAPELLEEGWQQNAPGPRITSLYGFALWDGAQEVVPHCIFQTECRDGEGNLYTSPVMQPCLSGGAHSLRVLVDRPEMMAVIRKHYRGHVEDLIAFRLTEREDLETW